MYEDYSRQSLPSKKYRELLGSAICVFNSNNLFIIENILKISASDYKWSNLIDMTSGKLLEHISSTIAKSAGDDILHLFKELVNQRNRIVHSFQVTHPDGNQILATKDKDNKQYFITEKFLLDFIKFNESLSSLLHNLRGN